MTDPNATDIFDLAQQDAEAPKATGDELTTLIALGAELIAEMAKAAQIEKDLAAHKKRIAELQEQAIPTRMKDLKLESLSLEGGATIEVEEFWSVSLSDGKKGSQYKANAITLLKKTGNESLIKVGVGVEFKVGQEEAATKLVEALIKKGYAVKRSDDVNTGSFKALLKEWHEDGQLVKLQVDLPSVGAFMGKRAAVRLPK